METEGSTIQKVHFTITGEHVTKVARDFLTSDLFHLAYQVIIEDMHGMDPETGLLILTGKKKLIGDSDNGIFLEDDNVTHVNGIPIDAQSLWNRASLVYLRSFSRLSMLQQRIVLLANSMNARGGGYRKGIVYDDKYGRSYTLKGDAKMYREELEVYEKTAKGLEMFGSLIGKTMRDVDIKKMPITHMLVDIDGRDVWDVFKFEDLLKYSLKHDLEAERWNRMAESQYGSNTHEEVDKYIKNAIRLDKKAESLADEGELLEPNPISDMNDAGWLSPTGDWFGENGGIANFIHLNIARMLVESNVIPKKAADNPDDWMDNNGWVKIHGNRIIHWGAKKTIMITPAQMDALKAYAVGLIKKGEMRVMLGSLDDKTMIDSFMRMTPDSLYRIMR
jgi:hypothetical protein